MYRTGYVVVVCTSPVDGVPKYPQDQVIVGVHGFEGDYHNRAMRRSFSEPGTFKPNSDRHVSILSKEAVDSVCSELGITLEIGSLGENILTEGLGDLSWVRPDSSIVIGPHIRLVVTGQNKPCVKVAQYHPHFNKTIWTPERQRRGLLAAVVGGVGLNIRPGDLITITSPL